MNCSNANAEHPTPHSAPELELPDWSGMKTHSISATPAEAFRWNAEMLALFPPSPDRFQQRRKRCTVEFTL